MTSDLAQRVKERLKESEIVVKPEKRGEAKLPGVPDTVFWLRPTNLPVGWCFPLLFELENKGKFSDAYRDVTEFAKRYEPRHRNKDDDYKYSITWPTTVRDSYEQLTLPVTYDMRGMSTSSLVIGEKDVSEEDYHDHLVQYYISNQTAITTEAVDIRTYSGTKVVFWTVAIKLTNGVVISDIVYPFIVSFGSEFEKTVRQRFPRLKLLTGVYIGGEGTTRTETKTRDTGIEFSYMRLREQSV